jgi:alpha-L-rhamnosidase
LAYKRIVIKPQPVGDITFAKATYQSVYGEVVSDWKIENGIFVLDVTIPANTTADIYLPGSKKIIKTGSGKYQYKIKMK